jgi:SAM-dependent methyltransferase
VRHEASVPNDADEALAWLYRAEEALCDLIWHVIAGLSRRRPHRLLDVGCGEGGTAVRFFELAQDPTLEVVGVTLSERQQQIAVRNCPPGEFVLGDILTVELPRRFDVAYAIESTEYLGSAGLARFMERMNEWLIPEGLLVVVAGCRSPTLPPDDPLIWAFDAHYRTRLASSGDYRRLAAQSELQVAADINLGPATLTYWRTRRDQPVLHNSEDGAIEALIVRALEAGVGEYHLWAWYRKGRS